MANLARHMMQAALALAVPAGALAQIGLPSLPAIGVDDLGDVIGGVADLERLSPRQLARGLEQARLERIAAFLRRNPDFAVADAAGRPAVRGVLLVSDADDAAIERAEAAGFRLLGRERIEGIELPFARFASPARLGLAPAAARLAGLVGTAEVTVDHYYFPAGETRGAEGSGALAPSTAVAAPAVGIIDGAVGRHPTLTGPIEQRGFAPGAPRPSAHGTAVASLIAGSAPQRAAAPGVPLLVADVYGSGPEGGTATSIARALGWMVERRVPVVTLSLVGPENPLLRRAIRAAQGGGMLVVAAVGNDGPAAPPAYPASWPGVLAVTATDQARRALPEAGRALHVDFAAPGAGIRSAALDGKLKPVRGTSFAAPLVAGRLARHYRRIDIETIRPAVSALIAEARDLGKNGRDPVFGHGLVCPDCGAR